MKSLNTILEETGLDEEYRSPLISLQEVCKKLGVDDEESWAEVLQCFLHYIAPARELVKDFNGQLEERHDRLMTSKKVLDALKLGEPLFLSSTGCRIDITAFRAELQGVFEEYLKNKHCVSDIVGVELSLIPAEDKCKTSSAIELGQCVFRLYDELPGVFDKLKTKTAKHILIGEILYISGVLKEYGVERYWKIASNDKTKADYIRDWLKAFQKQLDKPSVFNKAVISGVLAGFGIEGF